MAAAGIIAVQSVISAPQPRWRAADLSAIRTKHLERLIDKKRWFFTSDHFAQMIKDCG